MFARIISPSIIYDVVAIYFWEPKFTNNVNDIRVSIEIGYTTRKLVAYIMMVVLAIEK
ncbi:hypothetical protein Lalb_Chr20g0115721 [Lupinus albus]|uniref:Uncharacterized protein n=1 Tax=Lupinus albus TaxID=3870 RepID=A0A6A4NXD4_LUPAL|nr:hypothetical protein Lalb_Chr20g0115721 [Lupinus albus]